MSTVTIPEDEYRQLKHDAIMFQALDTMGVDNWDGWSDAVALADKWRQEDEE